ncbi:MAG: thymidine phosphorylase, partial [Pirellulaceae bacterium]|nr:thymidine phosphorylase [Pirellulaceae bacterium]
MTIVSILKKKRDGHALSDAEISQIVDGVTRETIPDYQISAFAMAVFLRSMNDFETTSLTQHMLRSGETIHWSSHGFPVVDKHSTGGVGDKVSLVLAP